MSNPRCAVLVLDVNLPEISISIPDEVIDLEVLPKDISDPILLDVEPDQSPISFGIDEESPELELPNFVVKYTGNIEDYDGPYDATPLTTSQILSTKEKRMRNDVTIYMIPTRETYNDSGGVTFEIGYYG